MVGRLGESRDGGGIPIPGDDRTGSTVTKCLFCKTACRSPSFFMGKFSSE